MQDSIARLRMEVAHAAILTHAPEFAEAEATPEALDADVARTALKILDYALARVPVADSVEAIEELLDEVDSEAVVLVGASALQAVST